MPENKHWAEGVLKKLEEETKFVRDIEREVKILSDELREYLNKTSSVGFIGVTYSKSGNVLDASWTIEVGDASIRFSPADIRNSALTYDGYGAPIAEEIDIKKALEKIIRGMFYL